MAKPLAREYRGFLLSKDCGFDAPWKAWREDGTKFRADTLAGIKYAVKEHVGKEA